MTNSKKGNKQKRNKISPIIYEAIKTAKRDIMEEMGIESYQFEQLYNMGSVNKFF